MEYWNQPSLKMMGVDTQYFDTKNDIQQDDFLIIGLPLHGNFKVLDDFDYFLNTCDEKNAKV